MATDDERKWGSRDLQQHVRTLMRGGNGAAEVRAEHERVSALIPMCTAFLQPSNKEKNRFPNLLLFDATRVLLDDDFAARSPDTYGDYVHASQADGFQMANEYILAQSPHSDETEQNFWRMVWHYKCPTLVLLTPLRSYDGKVAFATNFWPNTHRDKDYCSGKLHVRTDSMTLGQDCDYYEVTVSVAGVRLSHSLQLLHYRSWANDDDVPASLLPLAHKVRLEHDKAKLRQSRAEKGPCVVTCSSGVHRSGTLVALDICLRRLTEQRRVALKETVSVLRSQRYGVCHYLSHYLSLGEMISQAAMQGQMVAAEDIADLGHEVRFDR